jgi:hypothetical protein
MRTTYSFIHPIWSLSQESLLALKAGHKGQVPTRSIVPGVPRWDVVTKQPYTQTRGLSRGNRKRSVLGSQISLVAEERLGHPERVGEPRAVLAGGSSLG